MVSRMSTGASPVIRLGLGFCFLASVMAFNMSTNSNLVMYYGQNSYGATNPGKKDAWQQSIDYYCQDDTVDVLPMAFLNQFYSTGDKPTINLSNTCSTTDDPVFPGTNLPNCTFLAAGIDKCQKAGKIVTLSIGGSTGQVTFANDSDGTAYAQMVWDIFLGGKSDTRPFGAVVLDGIDMDIEGGSQTGYTAFLTALRSLMNGGDKKYHITAGRVSPQCPFPDSYIGATLNAFPFDAVYVQFYNNACGLNHFNNSNAWNFGTWDNWAKHTSPNKDVKVYIGAPGSASAASTGYVNASTLATIIDATRRNYTSFGGVMLWDASQAYANGRYDKAVKAALVPGGGNVSVSTALASTSMTLGAVTTGTPMSSGVVSARIPTSSGMVTTRIPTSSGMVTTRIPTSSGGVSASIPTSSGMVTARIPTSSGMVNASIPTSSGMMTTRIPTSSGMVSARIPTSSGVVTASIPTSSGMVSARIPTSSGRVTTAATSSALPATTTITSSCAGVSAWQRNQIYVGGDEVTYDNKLWRAQWWTEVSIPGGPDDVWSEIGSC